MPEYGSASYWDRRYEDEVGDPYDWLFSHDDVASVIADLVPDKAAEILLVGSGNAPFSPDL